MPRATPLTLGLDEAGRGPALGPMVLAAVALDARAAAALTRAGLTDSKAYGAGAAAHAARSALAAQIRQVARHAAIEVVPVDEIDRRVARGELNALERDVAARLIDAAPPCARIIADGARLFGPLAARYPALRAYDGGETRHAAVAAASVLAKVARDDAFAALCARYHAEFGPITGGGYVNDGTRRFLRAYAERHGALPPDARRSWPHPYLAGLLRPEAPTPPAPPAPPPAAPPPRQLALFGGPGNVAGASARSAPPPIAAPPSIAAPRRRRARA